MRVYGVTVDLCVVFCWRLGESWAPNLHVYIGECLFL